MIAVDTNILVHAHRKDASLHTRAYMIIQQLAEDPTPWAVCYHSLIEFYGVVTHTRLWQRPSTPAEAWDQISAWRESPSLRILFDSLHTLPVLEDLTQKGAITAAMIHDARIAACCLDNGVHQLWSCDRDFSRFPGLKTFNPLLST